MDRAELAIINAKFAEVIWFVGVCASRHGGVCFLFYAPLRLAGFNLVRNQSNLARFSGARRRLVLLFSGVGVMVYCCAFVGCRVDIYFKFFYSHAPTPPM